MNGKLPYVDKHVSVCETDVNTADLNQRTLHQLDERQRHRRRKFRVSYVRCIQMLHTYNNRNIDDDQNNTYCAVVGWLLPTSAEFNMSEEFNSSQVAF